MSKKLFKEPKDPRPKAKVRFTGNVNGENLINCIDHKVEISEAFRFNSVDIHEIIFTINGYKVNYYFEANQFDNIIVHYEDESYPHGDNVLVIESPRDEHGNMDFCYYSKGYIEPRELNVIGTDDSGTILYARPRSLYNKTNVYPSARALIDSFQIIKLNLDSQKYELERLQGILRKAIDEIGMTKVTEYFATCQNEKYAVGLSDKTMAKLDLILIDYAIYCVRHDKHLDIFPGFIDELVVLYDDITAEVAEEYDMNVIDNSSELQCFALYLDAEVPMCDYLGILTADEKKALQDEDAKIPAGEEHNTDPSNMKCSCKFYEKLFNFILNDK